MNNAFSPLEGDNDILLFNKDTFTVSRFKELVWQTINTKLSSTLNEKGGVLFTTNFCTLPIAGEVKLVLNNIQWCNSPIDCQLLKVGSQGWQKGKIRIQVDTKILVSSKANEIHLCIEFSPDAPTEPESPLDDLRQLPKYKQQG
jgi:hypothetical protein